MKMKKDEQGPCSGAGGSDLSHTQVGQPARLCGEKWPPFSLHNNIIKDESSSRDTEVQLLAAPMKSSHAFTSGM